MFLIFILSTIIFFFLFWFVFRQICASRSPSAESYSTFPYSEVNLQEKSVPFASVQECKHCPDSSSLRDTSVFSQHPNPRLDCP